MFENEPDEVVSRPGTGLTKDRLVGEVVLVVEEAKSAAGLIQVVTGKCAGAFDDVLFGVALVYAHREELHDLAGEVFIGFALEVLVVVQEADHGGIVNDAVEKGSKVASCVFPQELNLSMQGIAVIDDAVLGGEVPVPEESQLFLERTG